MKRFFAALIGIGLTLSCSQAVAGEAEKPVLLAKVIDMQGAPVAGAKIFLYDSPNIRRPADFISPVSDSRGEITLQAPAGRYWAVARFKSDGKYGPLMPGDRHSGEPAEVEIAAQPEGGVVFVVADIHDLGQKKVSTAADAVRVAGHVRDAAGNPVAGAYMFAHRAVAVDGFPDYLSTWTDSDGACILYLPAEGRYFVGASTLYPPQKLVAPRELAPAKGKIDIAIDVQITVQ